MIIGYFVSQKVRLTIYLKNGTELSCVYPEFIAKDHLEFAKKQEDFKDYKWEETNGN